MAFLVVVEQAAEEVFAFVVISVTAGPLRAAIFCVGVDMLKTFPELTILIQLFHMSGSYIAI